jgi:hypothetical protein
MWDAKGEEVDIGEVLVGKGKHKKLIVEELKAIHEYIITNSTTTKVAYTSCLNLIFYTNPL